MKTTGYLILFMLLIMSIFELGCSNNRSVISDTYLIPSVDLKDLDKMGTDSSAMLNSYEADFFNSVFKQSLNGFDFTGKKVGFIFNGARSNKNEFLELEKDRFNRNTTPNQSELCIFDVTQKKESGGYDVVIMYWCKIYIPANDLVKKLREKF